MLKEYFTTKKQELVEEKAKLESVDYSGQIAEEVECFKQQKAKEIEDFEIATKQKYDDIKSADVSKVNCYIEFVDKELQKIEIQEAEALKAQTTEESIVQTEGGV